jgi:hypothetical protein
MKNLMDAIKSKGPGTGVKEKGLSLMEAIKKRLPVVEEQIEQNMERVSAEQINTGVEVAKLKAKVGPLLEGKMGEEIRKREGNKK